MASVDSGACVPKRRQKNLLYLGTSYNELENFHTLRGRHWLGPNVKYENFDDSFRAFVERKADSIEVGLSRIRAKRDAMPDDGYRLQVHFTVVGLNENSKTAKMGWNDDRVSVDFLWDRPPESSDVEHNFLVKTVVKILEYEDLENPVDENSQRYTVTLKSIITKPEVYIPMYCLLRLADADERIFSGRQGDEFAEEKIKWIEQASWFAEDFFRYRSRKQEGKLSMELKEKMDSILHDVFGHWDLAQMLLVASRLGLAFLEEVVEDCMVGRMRKEADFAVDVLLSAVDLQKEELGDKAADFFVKNSDTVKGSERWKRALEEDHKKVRCVMHEYM